MFKDYYQILDIPFTASKQEIKDAYRRMSLRWHPDKNPNVDVTDIMQIINEAYKILSDVVSKERYDKEYFIFSEQKNQNKVRVYESPDPWTWNYDIKDEKLKDDISFARAYAKELVDEFFAELRGVSQNAVKGAWAGIKYFFGGKKFEI